MHLLAELCRDVGDTEIAATLYRQLLPHDGKVAAMSFLTVHAPISRDLGILAAMTGNLEQASKHFEDAMKTAHELDAITWMVRIRYDHARTLFEYGDPTQHEQAHALAEQAKNDADTYTLTALQSELQALLQSH
jgi:ATP/maltotriose-dependent transcriptional regulator MalT